MSSEPQSLPMAPSGCELDEAQLAEQLARYRGLGESVLDVKRDGTTARIQFSESIDSDLLEQTLAIERGCCSFFTLDYDPSARVISISAGPQHGNALAALITALTPR